MKKRIITITGTLVVLYAIYHINVLVQTKLGEKALAETGLVSINLETAKLRSSETGKPVLVELSAIWCPSCRKLDKKVMSNQDVKAMIQNEFYFVRLEYEDDLAHQFRDTYQVSGFPTLVVLNAPKDPFLRLPLSYSPIEILASLQQVIAQKERP